MEKNIFILDCPPEPFREDVVHTATPSVHTDFDVVLKDEGREITTGELHALIRIPDIRCCNFECVRECFNAEICFKRRRHFPGDHISTEPVEDGHEIGEAAFQFHVRDIRSPDLIWTDNVEASEQIWILLVQWVPLAQSLLFSRIYGLNTHLLHEAANVVTTDGRLVALGEFNSHPARAIERTVRVDTIDEALDPFILWIHERGIREAPS